ncbi:MAG: hypothetical protein CL927_05440 [Deltaproteobacteria bacterium]|nr:hypothetical protein [Deltaproteobacteria bacterium]HCH64465.1 hypothetical protein [Deltaproteobacteria bacterium]
MPLFAPSILEDVRRISGARHSFLRQIAETDGNDVRQFLSEQAQQADPGVGLRWEELLHSLDNRRFVQGLGEVAAHAVLHASGWQVLRSESPGPVLVFADPDGEEVDVSVLSFIRQLRPLADRAIIENLVRCLDRLTSRSRVAVVVRRWLPHDFDPEPVRRAIDMWLQEVDRGGWEGRYAAYDDDDISLEFALTGRRAQPGEGVVAFTLGPLDALRTLESVQSVVSKELERWRHARSSRTDRPLLAVCASSLPWNLPRGYVRELLLGKPVGMTTGEDGMQLHYGIEQSPSILRDPLQDNVQGILFVEYGTTPSNEINGRAYLNPWARRMRDPNHFSIPSLARTQDTGESVTLRWFHTA